MFAVIYLPDFQLQAALRLEPERRRRPVALMEGTLVMQATDAARAADVEAGLTATQAMARCVAVEAQARSPAQEQTVTDMVLQCASCFSPNIESTAAGVCTLDLTGLPPRDDWAPWAGNILQALESLSLTARVGVGETPFLAGQAARQTERFFQVVAPDEFVAGLPLAALEPEPALLEILESWGVRQAGAFLALGKENIAQRLGPEGIELFERASDRQPRPLRLTRPAEIFEETREFEPPVESLEPLLFVLRRFVEQLARRLEAVYKVAAVLRLELTLETGALYERILAIPAPTSDVETLFRALQTHLENVRTDAAIGKLRLAAQPGRVGHYQFGLFEAALRDPNQFHESLARLTALLGPERAGTPRLEASHRPDAFRMDMEAMVAPETIKQPAGEPPADPPTGPALRRFRPPLAALVEVRSDKPVWLRSAAFTGAIAGSRGPWRLSGQWWDGQRWAREEWEVQTRDGALLRLVRQEDQWTVEGTFD